MNARQQITGANYGSYLTGEYGFDSFGYPKHIKAKVGSTYRQDYRYAFNTVTGNLTTRKDSIPGEMKTESFTYDNLDRLLTVTGPQNLTMGYAANGNITNKSDLGTANLFLYGNSASPYRLTGLETNTALVPETQQVVSYTSFEQPAVITEGAYQAAFLYNNEGQRAKMEVKQSGNTVLTRWYAGSRYIKETAGAVTKEYWWLGGDAYSAPILAVKQGSTTTYYYILRDHLGTITHLTNTSGTVQNRYSFDAWGRRRSPDSWEYLLPAQTDLLPGRGFTGHEQLPHFGGAGGGLYNMNGRLYDPVVGRFLSPDNNVQTPDYSQNFNRYSYCLNNPLKYTDPDGEVWWLVPAIVAAVFATGNTVTHAIRSDIHNLWDGLKYFGQGALTGAVLGATWQFAPLIPFIGSTIQTGMSLHGAAILGSTALSTLSGLGQGVFSGNWSALGNSGQIFLGNFYLDENRSFFGGVWQGISRHTWEFPQTGLGHTFSQGLNTLGNIDDVGYFGGATIARGNIPFTRGVSYGAFIMGDDIAFDPFETVPGTNRLTAGARLLRHEYGHYSQSQVSGPLYLFKYGIPSATKQGWTEIDAEFRSDRYFFNNFRSVPAFGSYSPDYRAVNPKWWEFGLFFNSLGGGIWGYSAGSLIITLLNINKGR